MKFKRLLSMAIIISASLVFAETETDKSGKTPDKISWISYDEGLALAKEENKHLFIDFTAKWCGWCKKMDREVFVNNEVISILNDNFISVKVDGDSEKILDIDGYQITEKNLTKQEFQVTGYPAFWFLKSDGSKLGVLNGYQTTDKLLQVLDYVREQRYDTTKTKQEKKTGK